MTTIFLIGMDALNTCFAAKRMPEIFNASANLWRPARAYAEARQLAATDPTLVRLMCDARVLLEDLGSAPINLGDDLIFYATTLPASVPMGVCNAVQRALAVLKD